MHFYGTKRHWFRADIIEIDAYGVLKSYATKTPRTTSLALTKCSTSGMQAGVR